MANYEAYIERGMDARLLMEIRKSAVLPMAENLYDFYTGHGSLETVEEVKNFRINYLKKVVIEDYCDENWQYYLLVKMTQLGRAKYFAFDFESCFADGDYRKQTYLEDYKRGFMKARLSCIGINYE